MLRGIYREFVTVKIKNHRLYEEAVFVLKDTKRKPPARDELIFEANRILCENGIKAPQKRKKLLRKLLFSSILLILGAIIGAGVAFFIIK